MRAQLPANAVHPETRQKRVDETARRADNIRANQWRKERQYRVLATCSSVYQPDVPGSPLNGPTISLVIQPP